MSYGANKLVIDTHTHEHTDPQTQAMTIPEGQNWPRAKMDDIIAAVNVINLKYHKCIKYMLTLKFPKGPLAEND